MFIFGIQTKDMTNKTFKIIDTYPSYTIEQWVSTYKIMYEHCVVNKNDNYTFNTLKPYMVEIKKFLKSKGQKFN